MCRSKVALKMKILITAQWPLGKLWRIGRSRNVSLGMNAAGVGLTPTGHEPVNGHPLNTFEQSPVLFLVKQFYAGLIIKLQIDGEELLSDYNFLGLVDEWC
jgi:hypothetical protein